MVFHLSMHPILFNVLVLIASVYILFKASDLIVDGIGGYAKQLGLSDHIVGFVVVAMAASMPEVVSSLMGLFMGDSGVMFGSILGTNMLHSCLVVGVLAVVSRKLPVEAKLIEKAKLPFWFAMMLPLLLIGDGTLSRTDGVVLLAAFFGYLSYLWRIEGTLGKLKKNIKLKNIWRDCFVFLGALVALLLAGRWLVFSAVTIAKEAGIPSYFISLTIIATATAFPDFVVGLRSVKKGRAAIGIGDLLGSIPVQLLLYFGMIGLINPVTIPLKTVTNVMIFLALGLTALVYSIKLKQITWRYGLLFISLYATFILIETWKVIG